MKPRHQGPSLRVLRGAFRPTVAVALASIGGLLPVAAAAEPIEQSSLVVTTRGVSNSTTKPLMRDIRRQLADALGPLRSSRAWHRAWRDMAFEPAASTKAQNMARAARTIGADHLLDLNVYEAESKWVLQVRLIRASDGRILRRPRYPYASMGKASRRWHAKEIVTMALDTLDGNRRERRAANEDREPTGRSEPAGGPQAAVTPKAPATAKPPPPPQRPSPPAASTATASETSRGPSPTLVVPTLDHDDDFADNSPR